MARKREGRYGAEFHKGFKIKYHRVVGGDKIHASMYQPKGFPDNVYYGDEDFWGTTFIGIEDKYKVANKRRSMDLKKLLRPEQRVRLHEINKFGGYGLQLTYIEFDRDLRYAVITRPFREFECIAPCDVNLYERASQQTEIPEDQNCIVLKRRTGDIRKVPPDERYRYELLQYFYLLGGPICLR